METKAEGEKKITKKDDMMIKGHLEIIEGLRQTKTIRDDQSSKSSTSSSSSSSYIMKIKIGNCELSGFENICYIINYELSIYISFLSFHEPSL